MLGSSAHAIGSVVRRGLEAPVDPQLLEHQTMAYENSPFEVSDWSVYALLAAVVFSAFCIISVRYTNWEIISTIAMIESPSTTVLVKTEKPLSEKPDALVEDLIDAEVITLKTKPITSSIRNTTAYLRAKTGPFFRFRGLFVFVIYHAAHTSIHSLFMNMIGNLIGNRNFVTKEARFEDINAMMVDLFLYAATSALFAPLAMAFTHVVISMPANKKLSERVAKYSAIRKSGLISATVAHALIKRFTFTIPVFLFMGFGLNDIKNVTEEDVKYVVLTGLMISLISILYAFTLLRATVTLVRIHASLLPADVEPVVNFDRTFGGKLVSEADGGNGRLSFFDARPDTATIYRLVGMFAKMVLIDIKLHILAGLLIAGVAYTTMGEALTPFIVSSHAQLTGRTLPVSV